MAIDFNENSMLSVLRCVAQVTGKTPVTHINLEQQLTNFCFGPVQLSL